MSRDTLLPSGTDIDPEAGMNIPADGRKKLLVRVTNTVTNVMKVMTVKAGVNPPAMQSSLGDLSVAVPESGDVLVVPELTRFAQRDGSVNLDFEAGMTGRVHMLRPSDRHATASVIWEPGDTPPPAGNGLLNGLSLYGKMLDESLAVGPGPVTNVIKSGITPVTFGAGPVAGEGAAFYLATNLLRLEDNPSIQFGDQDWTAMIWLKNDYTWSKGWDTQDFNQGANVPSGFSYIDISDNGETFETVVDDGQPPNQIAWYLFFSQYVHATNVLSVRTYDGVNVYTNSTVLGFAPGTSVTPLIWNGFLLGNGNYAVQVSGQSGPCALWLGRALAVADMNAAWNSGAGLPFVDWTN